MVTYVLGTCQMKKLKPLYIEVRMCVCVGVCVCCIIIQDANPSAPCGNQTLHALKSETERGPERSCRMRVTVVDSDLRCTCVMYFER